jgi:hypothetical protein
MFKIFITSKSAFIGGFLTNPQFEYMSILKNSQLSGEASLSTNQAFLLLILYFKPI